MNNETEHIFLLNPAPSESSAPAQGIGALEPPPISQVNLDNVKDFSHVCRTCATITEFVMPIFADEGLQNNLADKIHKHLPIKVCKGDELPLVVCYQCASTLLAWHELVQCCMQADAALRAKLRSNQRKTSRPNIKPSASIEEETESKQPSCAYRSCVYCGAAQPAAAYRQHLVLQHADLLFHCEACDLLVERKDFLLHVSYHSVHYDTHDTIKKVKKELVSQNPSPVPPSPAPQSTTKTETKPPDKTENKKPPAVARTRNSVQENEFSDHSDMDDFGPLPESVFEAIEDSQDSQQLQDNSNQTPESERLGDESNKSSQLENKHSSDAAPSLDNNHFTNICSVDEPNDINSCDQNVKKVNKQSDTSNNIVLSANTTQSKAPDHHATAEKGKRNQNKLRKCPFCPKEYKASSSYFYHLKYFHRGSKEHECEVCGRKFGTRSCLTQHMAVHSAQYEFQCKHCHKQFKSKASLYIHEQTHGGKKAWACSQCQAAFRWRTHLLRHVTRHQADKAHACGACGRAFSVRGDLVRHARTHARGSFSCDKCGQNFAQLRYLKVHAMKQHNTNIKKSK